ncbi:hypothetical protein VC83_05606 [Pseudogymnoascus destructans]|uniref:NEDD8-activating enzyme E1 regulatory subunit n=2 Tax=Pseudogymnoascus destructans TaxID=655981 RepID=L8FVJ9_PSED2|nr:uncharacterized protein VC83_05606 [Pseudogymnoascus destructans]ELR03771.1 hypothetical protein GMDG_06398 [Pseudogymnoascus destructans 20631-21]OAF57759.2 hypothetical protein VC83_05606 [Pseudogymnoascus destructans]
MALRLDNSTKAPPPPHLPFIEYNFALPPHTLSLPYIEWHDPYPAMTEIISGQVPPLILGPSDKEKKYDRQLRLWAANGQQALEDAHICLINSGSGTTGVETLKNLVLPGIGQFTIVDDKSVDESDLGVNFFLEEASLGRPRAECCKELLGELNPDATGHWATSFDEQPAFTLVLYTTPVNDELLETVKKYCQTHKVPLVSINCLGFYSYFNITFNGNFPIVDTHPDSTATTDLRLLTPWPELEEFAQELTVDIDNLSAHKHGHVPYVALLLHYLEEWKAENSGSVPQSYADKVKFRKLVAAGATDSPEGAEENYDEATAAVLKTVSLPSLPSSARDVFEYEPNQDEAKSGFWIITEAIKQFHQKYGALPLPGSVPDMKAESEVYIQLQSIYKKKARQDVNKILEILGTIPNGSEVEKEEVETYCKNAAFIKLVRESAPDLDRLKQLADSELNAEFELQPTLLPVYLALKGSESAKPEPGAAAASAPQILSEISRIVPDAASDDRLVRVATEVARAQGGELHNISALTGGMVAQEMIKIITKQYIPIDNTCVFDGIVSRSQIFRI